ncbi:Hypothetical protein I5071_55990 [Sandaracinus amylolyticus]|nr:Hypothetical protein I5071_55990 [Sandaracinus amylolyticus]
MGLFVRRPTLSTDDEPGSEFLSFLDDLETDAVTAGTPASDRLFAVIGSARRLVARARVGVVELGTTHVVTGRTDLLEPAYTVAGLDTSALRWTDAYLRNAARSNPFTSRLSPLSLAGACSRNVGTMMMCVGAAASITATVVAGSVAIAAGTPLFVAGAAVFAGGVLVTAGLDAVGRSLRPEWTRVRETFPGMERLYDYFAPTDVEMSTISDCGDDGCTFTAGRCDRCYTTWCDPSGSGYYAGTCTGGGCATGAYTDCSMGCDATTGRCN